MAATAPGWHPDPYQRFKYRYWDGTQWSAHVSSGGGVTAWDPVGAPTAPVAVTPQATPQQAPAAASTGSYPPPAAETAAPGSLPPPQAATAAPTPPAWPTAAPALPSPPAGLPAPDAAPPVATSPLGTPPEATAAEPAPRDEHAARLAGLLHDAMQRYERLLDDLQSGATTHEAFRRDALRTGLVVEDDAAWLLDLPSGRWLRYDGIALQVVDDATEPEAKPSRGRAARSTASGRGAAAKKATGTGARKATGRGSSGSASGGVAGADIE